MLTGIIEKLNASFGSAIAKFPDRERRHYWVEGLEPWPEVYSKKVLKKLETEGDLAKFKRHGYELGLVHIIFSPGYKPYSAPAIAIKEPNGNIWYYNPLNCKAATLENLNGAFEFSITTSPKTFVRIKAFEGYEKSFPVREFGIENSRANQTVPTLSKL